MKDVRGTEIEVGDKVVTCLPAHGYRGRRYVGVELSVVTGFTPKMVRLESRLVPPEALFVYEKQPNLVHNDAQMDMGV